MEEYDKTMNSFERIITLSNDMKDKSENKEPWKEMMSHALVVECLRRVNELFEDIIPSTY